MKEPTKKGQPVHLDTIPSDKPISLFSSLELRLLMGARCPYLLNKTSSAQAEEMQEGYQAAKPLDGRRKENPQGERANPPGGKGKYDT